MFVLNYGPPGNRGCWPDLRASLERLNHALLREALRRLAEYRAQGLLTTEGRALLRELRGYLAQGERGGSVE
jgi:hypothetical protein